MTVIVDCRYFTDDVYLLIYFSAPKIRDRSLDHHKILSQWWPEILQLGPKFVVSPQKNGGPKTSKFVKFVAIADNFATMISDNYLRQETRNRQGKTVLETAISRAHGNLIWWTLLYKWQKIKPQLDPPNGRPSRCVLRISTHSLLLGCSVVFCQIMERTGRCVSLGEPNAPNFVSMKYRKYGDSPKLRKLTRDVIRWECRPYPSMQPPPLGYFVKLMSPCAVALPMFR